MRIESGKPMHNGGWLHKSEKPSLPVKRSQMPVEPRKLSPTAILAIWRAARSGTNPDAISAHASELGVSAESLNDLGVAWDNRQRAWLWPLHNERGEMIGGRYRTAAGDKWSIRGGRAGLFFTVTPPTGTVWIVEGGTDCAALITLGLSVIGRHACIGQEEMLVNCLRRVYAKKVLIIADNDEPGIKGAAKLQAVLPLPSKMILLPAKDAREFVRAGGTREELEAIARDFRMEEKAE